MQWKDLFPESRTPFPLCALTARQRMLTERAGLGVRFGRLIPVFFLHRLNGVPVF